MDGLTGPTVDNQTTNTGSAAPGTQEPATGSSLKDIMTGGTPPAEKPKTEPASADNSASGAKQKSDAQLAPWGDQLSRETRENAEIVKGLAKFKSIDDLAKSYHELSGMIGSRVSIPGKDASPEDRAAFWAKIGRPETADKYGFKQDDPTAKEFAQAVFEAGLTDEQAKSVYNYFTGLAEKAIRGQAEQLAAQEEKTEADLKAKYKDKYPEKVEHLKRALTAFGSPELTKVLNSSGLAFHPALVEAFMSIGERMGEAGATNRGGSGGSRIKSLMEGGSFNYD